MKRVVCCALCIIFLIASVSAANLSKIPGVTSKVIGTTTPKYNIYPDLTPTLDSDEVIITFESTPPGANVYAWGFLADQVTPFSLKTHVAPATIPIIISYPGYQEFHQNLTVIPRQTYTVSAVLIPVTSIPTTQPTNPPVDSVPTTAPATPSQVQAQPTGSGSSVLSPDTTGSLSVTTTPAGAEVSLDNEVKGITPAMISGLSPGTHTLTITKAGYRNFTTTISIEAGKVREYSTGLSDAAPPAGTPAAKSPGFALGAAFAAVFGIALVWKRTR
jgi:hypothetical protein